MSGASRATPIFPVLVVVLVCVRGGTAGYPYRATRLTHDPTEVLYIEDGFPKQRTYKVEDFFWTGSGDGAPEYPEEPWAETERIPTTVYRTKTVMSTVYISIMTVDNQSSTSESSTPECAIDCETVTVPAGVEISPTPTLSEEPGTVTGESPVTAVTPVAPVTNTTDRQFWLLTIIRTNHSEPTVTVLEKQLAHLYSVAFRRQQERHLGIGRRSKRNLKPIPNGKPVYVHIYNISKHDDEKVEVLYHVQVLGQPVAAVTAAHDMKLVSDEEASAELGYPILTKAEPYLRVGQPQSLARARDTWLFVGVVLAAVLLLLLTVTSFTLCLKKRPVHAARPAGLANRQRVFEHETAEGVTEGYVERPGDGKTYKSGKRHKPADTLSGHYKKGISISSPSSLSSSSSSSLSSPTLLSPRHLVGQRRRHKPANKRPAALNKALVQRAGAGSVEAGSESSGDRSEMGLVRGRVSPKSYLSMPSVKSFPRSSIPETLNRVLEPVSVLHLDINDDVVVEQYPGTQYEGVHRDKQPLARHGSMGCEDPGVIGPVVWDMHCKRMQQDQSSIDEPDDIKSMTRMRRRFNDLMDDTFTLFGSGRESQLEPSTSSQNTRCTEPRGHSATNIR